MKLSGGIVAACLAIGASLIGAAPSNVDRAESGLGKPKNINDFQKLAMKALEKAEPHRKKNGCTLKNARVRKDW